MLKKILVPLLILCVFNFISYPAYAKNMTVDAVFKTELNVNKASKGEVVQFVSVEDSTIDDFTIPSGTIFEGSIKKFKKGRWAYRRAKALIVIDKMILPSGETYNIHGNTKRHVLKGSAIGNVAKGIVSLPAALVVGTAGALVIVVETISIAGLIIVGPTSYLFGRTMGTLTHGINCKRHEGDSIKLIIKDIPTIPNQL